MTEAISAVVIFALFLGPFALDALLRWLRPDLFGDGGWQ